MKIVVIVAYIGYLFSVCDSLIVKPLLPFHLEITVAYLIFILGLTILYFVLEHQDAKKTILLDIRSVSFLLLLSMLLFNFARSKSSPYTITMNIILVLIIFCQANLFRNMLKGDRLFIYISYLFLTFFLLKQSYVSGVDFIGDLRQVNFSTLLFGTERYRADFGFYNINGTGNLCACALILSMMAIYYIVHDYYGVGRTIRLTLCIACDLLLTIILILADSRNAIFTVLICMVSSAFLGITYLSSLKKNSRHLLQFILAILGIILIVGQLLPNIAQAMFVSGRSNAITINLQVLDNFWKQLFGIGMVDAGSFSNGFIGGHSTITLDNYYIYLLICNGIIGLVIFLVVCYFIGKRLYREINANSLYIILFSAFVAHLISGWGETCVLYYSFPSSMLFFSMYFICLIIKERLYG